MKRAARVLLVLVFAGIAAAAAYQAIARSRALDATAQRQAELAAAAARADLALVELAASQRGYVAPGQGIDFWVAKVDEASAAVRTEMARLREYAEHAAAQAQASAVLARLDDFAVMDERARAYAGSGQRAVASELIFADGYEILAAARAELASASSLGQAAAAAPAVRDRQIRLGSIAALGAIAGLGLVLMLRGPRPTDAIVTAPAPVDIAPASAPEAGIRQDEPAVVDENIGAALDASLEGLDEVAPAPRAPAPDRPSATAVADLCVDLARLLDARDLEAVLARATSALGAAGLVVWMVDDTGQSIAPALIHGYPASLVARLRPLSSGDDNATVAAWRAGSAQVVDGALAAPLLTSLGCTGVLAIEFRNGGEHDVETQALARIIAAQLATTISPAATASRHAAGG